MPENSGKEFEDRKDDPTAVPEDADPSTATEKPSSLPEVTFSTFIFSLNSSALVNLGILDDPATGGKSKNLPLAKQTIDIIGMLEEKTKGNLDEQEENFLKNILFDLRMRFVQESN